MVRLQLPAIIFLSKEIGSQIPKCSKRTFMADFYFIIQTKETYSKRQPNLWREILHRILILILATTPD